MLQRSLGKFYDEKVRAEIGSNNRSHHHHIAGRARPVKFLRIRYPFYVCTHLSVLCRRRKTVSKLPIDRIFIARSSSSLPFVAVPGPLLSKGPSDRCVSELSQNSIQRYLFWQSSHLCLFRTYCLNLASTSILKLVLLRTQLEPNWSMIDTAFRRTIRSRSHFFLVFQD